MTVLNRIARALERFVNRVGELASWLAMALMAVIIFDVVTRRFLVLGSTKLQEMEWHLHGVLFLLCLGYAYLKNAHVRIEIIRDRLKPRTQAWIELIGCLLFLVPYALVIIYFDFEFAKRAFQTGEVSSALTGLPYRWIIKSFIGLGFFLLVLAAITVSIRSVRFLLEHGKDDPAPFSILDDPEP